MEPGFGYGGYIRLADIIEAGNSAIKNVFSIKDGNIYADGIILQEIKVAGEYVQINGTHYTSWENATQIKSMKRIEPSMSDPYVYVSEPGG